MNKKISCFLLIGLFIMSATYVKATDSLTISVNNNVIQSDNTASIYWNTNLEASCSISYSVNSDLSDNTNANGTIVQRSDSKFNYYVRLTGLQKSNDYYYKIICTINNETTAVSEILKLSYSKINIQEISNSDRFLDNSVTINWTTNYESSCEVLYGLNSNLDNSQTSLGTLWKTSATETKNYYETKLLDLITSNKYYYKIKCSSIEANANESSIFEISAKTEAKPDLIIKNIIIIPLEAGVNGVRVKYSNIGKNLSKTSFKIKLNDRNNYLNEATDTQPADFMANEERYKDFSLSNGTYNLTATIDYENIITEANENNNTLEKTLVIGEANNFEQKNSEITTDTQISNINDKAKSLHDGKIIELLTEIKLLRDQLREQAAELKYLKIFAAEMRTLSANMQTAIKTFIAYGVDDNTKKLGEGERAAVINSYEAAFDKLPQTEAELADAIKIANGRFPSITNDKAELRAKEQFLKIFKRVADMNDANDTAAIKVMAYGLRQKAQNRNLNSEKIGINTFKNIFGLNPKTTEDWNTMQAITYSGATRKTDSDKDGLADETEKKLGTNLNNTDSDEDGYKDGTEVLNGFDPLKK